MVLVYRTMDGEEGCGRWHYTALAHSPGRIFLGLWQDLIQNSLTGASRGFCSQLSALLPAPIRELSHSAQAFIPLTSPQRVLGAVEEGRVPCLRELILSRRLHGGKVQQAEYLSLQLRWGDHGVTSSRLSAEVLQCWSRNPLLPFPALPPERLRGGPYMGTSRSHQYHVLHHFLPNSVSQGCQNQEAETSWKGNDPT